MKRNFTVADLIVVKNYILGKQELSPAMIKYYDLNNDGKVTSMDYVKIAKVIGLNEMQLNGVEKGDSEE